LFQDDRVMKASESSHFDATGVSVAIGVAAYPASKEMSGNLPTNKLRFGDYGLDLKLPSMSAVSLPSRNLCMFTGFKRMMWLGCLGRIG